MQIIKRTLTISLAVVGLIRSSIIKTTIPRSSFPRRPARPLIWIYSPEVILNRITSLHSKANTLFCTQRNSFPSNFLAAVNKTVRAGIFNPILNVSVANKALIKPSPKRISIVSLIIGNNPE
jgi:hypothetical protein